MSEPLTPRLEQVRQAVLLLLGDPDATLADLRSGLTDIYNEHLNEVSKLNDIYAQMQDLVYPQAVEGSPGPSFIWPHHFWNWLVEYRETYGDAAQFQAAADDMITVHLPTLATLAQLTEDVRLISSQTRDALYHNPGGGAQPIEAVNVLMEISAKLSAVITGQGVQSAALATMSETLVALLECCQEGSGSTAPRPYPTGACPGYDARYEAREWVALAYDATDYPIYVAYRLDFGTVQPPSWFSIKNTPAGGTWFANTGLTTKQACFAFNEDINTAGEWYIQYEQAGENGPQGFVEVGELPSPQWSTPSTLKNLIGRDDPGGANAPSYTWHRLVRYAPTQANPPIERPGAWVSVEETEPQ